MRIAVDTCNMELTSNIVFIDGSGLRRWKVEADPSGHRLPTLDIVVKTPPPKFQQTDAEP